MSAKSSCHRVNCKCKCYVPSKSKWYKDKCRSCNHPNSEHGMTSSAITTRPRSTTAPILITNHNLANHSMCPFCVGDRLDVMYEDQWSAAQIIAIDAHRVQITYDEWDEYSDEWIYQNSTRLRKQTAPKKMNHNIRSISRHKVDENHDTNTAKYSATKPIKPKKGNLASIWEHKMNEHQNMDRKVFKPTARTTRSSSVSVLTEQFMNAANSSTFRKSVTIKNSAFSTGDCALCAASDLSNIIVLSQCKHKLCRDCMNLYIKVTCTDKLNIKCPFCSVALDRYQDVKPALTHKEFYEIYLSPNLKKCLSANCENTVKLIGSSAARLDCAQCDKSWCVHCNVPWHENMDCDGYKQTGEYQKTEQQFQEFLNDNKEGIKSCPKCAKLIQKNGGCNHMHCVSCDIHFCWKCLFSANDGNSIYSHMSDGCY